MEVVAMVREQTLTMAVDRGLIATPVVHPGITDTDTDREEIRRALGRIQDLERRVSALESEIGWLRRQNEAFSDHMSRWRSQLDALLGNSAAAANLDHAA